ncbi:hemerythrin domain-containing protein [Piscinibacter gummiphilus]|uniref:Hemerythrin domain-containing protein n=1 Tax=Piscinibacter gummiphilus TaxID=946333 RepID=A0ABZ0CM44_9BURK|nr:hemerythrin domain-containing protein [Piscinibacter gummiphilus]WOB05949.1 hemerythrin domain-containing protein [Piscinibacter gummiphilus]
MHATLQIIRSEHQALTAMLRTIRLLLSEHRRRNTLPDFSVLRAMLFYVDEFPEKLHHTKESTLLFPKLRGQGSEAEAVLDKLDADHARGEAAIRKLEHELLGFEMMGATEQGPRRRERFERAMEEYIDFYLGHMHVEESFVLPLAERVLSETEWRELDDAFRLNRDPIANYDADGPYRAVFQKVLMHLPAPLGLGPSFEARSSDVQQSPALVRT